MWAASRMNAALLILHSPEKGSEQITENDGSSQKGLSVNCSDPFFACFRLLVLEGGLALLQEGGHAFFLVLERERGVEEAPLEEDALGEGRLVGAVDGLLDHHHRGERVRGDLARHRE